MRTIVLGVSVLLSLSTAARAHAEPFQRDQRVARRERVAGIALVASGLAVGLPMLGVGAARVHGADGGRCCRDTAELNTALLGMGVVVTAAAIPVGLAGVMP